MKNVLLCIVWEVWVFFIEWNKIVLQENEDIELFFFFCLAHSMSLEAGFGLFLDRYGLIEDNNFASILDIDCISIF